MSRKIVDCLPCDVVKDVFGVERQRYAMLFDDGTWLKATFNDYTANVEALIASVQGQVDRAESCGY